MIRFPLIKFGNRDRVSAFIAGTLLCFQAAASGGALMNELFDGGDWLAARTEARRVLVVDPDSPEARYVLAISSVRLGDRDDDALTTLRDLASDPDNAEVSYELGRLLWMRGATDDAFDMLRQAFKNSSGRLFLLSGCSLHHLLRDHRQLAGRDPALVQQLKTVSALWTPAIHREARLPKPPRTPLTARPARGIIRFYQTQIGPAIGHRCSLDPSCSRYSMEASMKHGWKGIPMTADRLVREPSVVSSEQNPVRVNGYVRFRDPVSDHDGWFRRSR